MYRPHWHVQFTGQLGPNNAPIEQWSINLNIAPVGAHNPLLEAVPDVVAGNCANAMAAWIAQAQVAPAVSFEQCKIYQIGADGKAVTVPVLGLTALARGQSGVAAHPWQLSLVVTLDAARGLGPGRTGRIYMPPQCLSIDESDQITQTAVNNAASNAATFLDAINTAFTDLGTLCIASALGTGTNYPVESIRVGRVYDTQRRRRRSTVENYVVHDLAGGQPG
jgi:hypothetical protein